VSTEGVPPQVVPNEGVPPEWCTSHAILEVPPTSIPMRILPPEAPNGHFERVRHEQLRHELGRSNPAAFVLFVELISYTRRTFETDEHYCNTVGRSLSTFRKQLGVLKKAGLIRRDGKDLQIWPFGAISPEEEEPETTIMAEVAQLPRTQVRIPTKERWEMITKAWNDNRPEDWPIFGSKSEGVKIAIGEQMKRLGLETDDYDKYIGAVLRGASQDTKLPDQYRNPGAIFGRNGAVPDWQVERCERYYRLGLKTERQAMAVEAIKEAQEQKLQEWDKREAEDQVRAERANRISTEVREAYNQYKPDGWAEFKPNDYKACSMIRIWCDQLGATEGSYGDIVRKALTGYIGRALTPNEAAPPLCKFEDSPFGQGYNRYLKLN